MPAPMGTASRRLVTPSEIMMGEMEKLSSLFAEQSVTSFDPLKLALESVSHAQSLICSRRVTGWRPCRYAGAATGNGESDQANGR